MIFFIGCSCYVNSRGHGHRVRSRLHLDLSVRKFALLEKLHFNPVRHVYNKNSLRIHWRVIIYLNLNELMTQKTKTVSICKKTSLSNSIDTARTRNRKRTSENSHALLFDILTFQDLEDNFNLLKCFKTSLYFFWQYSYRRKVAKMPIKFLLFPYPTGHSTPICERLIQILLQSKISLNSFIKDTYL